MSANGRLISGNIAQWVQIGATMITQVVIGPNFLQLSGVPYAIWLEIQGILKVPTVLAIKIQLTKTLDFPQFAGKKLLLLRKALSFSFGIWLTVSILPALTSDITLFPVIENNAHLPFMDQTAITIISAVYIPGSLIAGLEYCFQTTC